MSILKKKFLIDSKFEVKYFIESTDFCEIYSAKNINSELDVSLNIYNSAKISRDDIDDSGELKEISFLKMSIKGLPTYVDHGGFSNKLEKFKYIATNLISGESVLDRMKRKGPYNEFDATSIIIQVLNIADILHSSEQPILFNGLSLNNLMIDMSGPSEKIVIRNIINFRKFSDSFNVEFIDGVNPNLLAPEVFNNVFTSKSDVYNVGALFYSLMFSVPPWYIEIQNKFFSKDSVDKIFESRNKLLNFPFEIDYHLKKTILKAVDFDVDKRFISSSNFIESLKREKQFVNPKKKSSLGKSLIKKGNGFKDIAGMEELKKILTEDVINIIEDKDKFKSYGVNIPNGMLLYGPPGCGKTFISEKFAEEVGSNFFSIKPSDLGSIYVHGAQEKIGSLFNEAENRSPSIIFFDEVDALMPKRESGTNQNISAEVNEFLAQMTDCSNRGIFVIAATNQPELIDEAILRTGRIDKIIYVPNPDSKAREKMFELYLKNRPTELSIDFKKLADMTENYVSSDIKYIIDQASRVAANKQIRISQKNLLSIISEFNPSVSKESLNKYNLIKNKFDNKNEQSSKPKRKPIGFSFSNDDDNDDIIGKTVEVTHPYLKGKKGKVISKIDNNNVYLIKFKDNEEGNLNRNDFKVL